MGFQIPMLVSIEVDSLYDLRKPSNKNNFAEPLEDAHGTPVENHWSRN
jgi:hypothetical protein